MSPPIEVEVYACTDVGLVRERNEDTVVLLELGEGQELDERTLHRVDVGQRRLVAAVLDGMGGAASGDIASRIGREALLTVLRRAEPQTVDSVAEAMGAAAVHGHRQIRNFAQHHPGSRGMGTTLTAAALVGRTVVLTHVGDSRAYIYRSGVLTQLSEDHSLVQELLREGRISGEDMAAYAHSNVILQALGVNSRVYPSISVGQLEAGDVLLLCSDGLSDMIASEVIASCLEEKDLAEAGRTLIQEATARGGYDNVSVVLARLCGEGVAGANADSASPAAMHLERVRVSSAPFAPRIKRVRFGDSLLVAIAFALMLLVAAAVIWSGR